MDRVLVTGTAGFIGFHLVKQLAGNSMQIVGLDNLNAYYDVRLKYDRLAESGIEEEKIKYGQAVRSGVFPNYRFIKLNLEDREGLMNLFEENKFDCVIHLAAQAGVRHSLEHPQTYIDSNLTGFLNILEACRKHPVRHLLFASSSSVYGNNTRQPFSEDDRVDTPVSLYAVSKKTNELMAYTYSHLFGIPSTGLRFFTVYGPWGRPDMAAFLFTGKMLEGQPIDVYNHGHMKRDFTYVEDIVRGVASLVEKLPAEHPPFRVFNIGHSEPVDLMHFIRVLEKKLGVKADMNFLPIQPGDVPETWADTTRLQMETGYQPSTTVEEGIENFVNWYREYYRC